MGLCLLAILTTPGINARVLTWKAFMLEKYGCKVALKSPAHITLIPPFNMRPEQVAQLEKDMLHFAQRKTEFLVHLENFAAFPPRVIYVHVVSNEWLTNLQANLEEFLLTKNYPIKKENRVFHPHVTIANRDLMKADFQEAWRKFEDQTYRSSFTANRISLLQHNGNIWEVTSEAPLLESQEK